MSESKNGLHGKRYISLLRVSTVLNDASIPDQRAANERFAVANGMVRSARCDEVLEGVSGAKIFNRHDLKRLLNSAKLNKDFDVVLVYDSSRLTRGGSDHGASIRRDFAKSGVLVQSVMDPVPEGDFKSVTQAIIDTQNSLYSKRLSGYITRGIVSAVLRGDVAHHGNVPIGIDRVYIRANGDRFLRLCYLGNGVREVRNEETGAVIERFKRGTGTAYRKQKSERVILVPGDPNTVNGIRDAFAMRYVEGYGFGEIGLHLTRLGVVPLKGNAWHSASVRNFLFNPIYLGWDYFLKTASGLFHKGSAEGPIKRDDVSQEELEEQGRETIPILHRHRNEMVRREQSEMAGFIVDPLVRQKTEMALDQFFDRHHIVGTAPCKGVAAEHLNTMNRNLNSSYLVTRIMREPNFDKRFAGKVTGKKDKRTRYYFLSGNTTFCEPNSFGRTMIRADAVDDAILEIIQHLFKSNGRVHSLINAYVEKALTAPSNAPDRLLLTKEMTEINSKLKAIYLTADAETLVLMKDNIKAIQHRKEELARQIGLRPLHTFASDSHRVASHVMAAVAELKGNMDANCYGKLRRMLRVIIHDFTMDLKTREGVLQFMMPNDLVQYGDDGFDAMCATFDKVNSAARRPHNANGMEIGVFRLIPPIGPNQDWPEDGKFSWVEVSKPSEGTVLVGAA